MAAASSGNVPVVERGVEEGGQTELVVDRQGERLGLEKGQPPQEDTKQHMNVVERHLDELTYCGSAINELELQLSRTKASYRRTLVECKAHLEETRRRLGACIPKSQPFIDVWRRARQIQEESNRAAARFDKASSQYAAAKEMIMVAERELANVIANSGSTAAPPGSREESAVSGDADAVSVNHAWFEMLNHATTRVVETEQEKRASEAEHRRILDRCTAVLEEYRTIERKLRPHIIKSRPYYEERWHSSQRLAEIKGRVMSLEEQLRNTKQRYAKTLHHLDQLNHSMHRQRRANSLTPPPTGLLDCHHQTASGASTPDLGRRLVLDHSDTESVQSWQVGEGAEFTGSTGSLPSIGSSLSDESGDRPHALGSGDRSVGWRSTAPVIRVTDEDRIAQLAQDIVRQSLHSAVSRLQPL